MLLVYFASISLSLTALAVGRDLRRLGPGDLMLLDSDGIVEAGSSRRRPFGVDRLCAAIERLREQPVQTICNDIVREDRAWAGGEPEDDMTIVVLRRAAS
jgi:serine phosphatase RsbU (regulator of sigma subunit)